MDSLFSDPQFGVLPLVAERSSSRSSLHSCARRSGWGRRSSSANTRMTALERFWKPTLEILAGIPTVVYGYFALTFVTPLLQDIGFKVGPFGALSAALVMGILLPTVASVSEDAMSAVPQDLRHRAYALGSTRMQVATRIVVPAAISGIVASFVLAISRGRRDHDRSHRRRRAAQSHAQSAGADSDDDRVHRGHSAGGCRDRLDGLQDDLRGRGDAVRRDARRDLLAIRLVRRFREVCE